MARVTLLAGLPGRSGKRGGRVGLPSVSEVPMSTFLDLSEARLSGKHGVLHISLPRDLSFPQNRVHQVRTFDLPAYNDHHQLASRERGR